MTSNCSFYSDNSFLSKLKTALNNTIVSAQSDEISNEYNDCTSGTAENINLSECDLSTPVQDMGNTKTEGYYYKYQYKANSIENLLNIEFTDLLQIDFKRGNTIICNATEGYPDNGDLVVGLNYSSPIKLGGKSQGEYEIYNPEYESEVKVCVPGWIYEPKGCKWEKSCWKSKWLGEKICAPYWSCEGWGWTEDTCWKTKQEWQLIPSTYDDDLMTPYSAQTDVIFGEGGGDEGIVIDAAFNFKIAYATKPDGFNITYSLEINDSSFPPGSLFFYDFQATSFDTTISNIDISVDVDGEAPILPIPQVAVKTAEEALNKIMFDLLKNILQSKTGCIEIINSYDPTNTAGVFEIS